MFPKHAVDARGNLVNELFRALLDVRRGPHRHLGEELPEQLCPVRREFKDWNAVQSRGLEIQLGEHAADALQNRAHSVEAGQLFHIQRRIRHGIPLESLTLHGAVHRDDLFFDPVRAGGGHLHVR